MNKAFYFKSQAYSIFYASYLITLQRISEKCEQLNLDCVKLSITVSRTRKVLNLIVPFSQIISAKDRSRLPTSER